METIERLPFRSLRNSEHPRVYNRLVAIVDKYNPATLHLSGPLNRAKAHLPELAKIEAQDRSSVLSKKLESIDRRRDNLIWAVTGMTKALATGDMPDKRPYVERIQTWLGKHKASTLAQDNYTAETERIDDMLRDAENNADIAEAMEVLLLTPYLTELNTVNKEFESVFRQRVSEFSAATFVNSKVIRSAADKDMRQLINFIELYQVEYPELDYLPLVNELNVLLSYYKAQLAARDSRRKSGVDTDNEPPIAEP